MSTSSISLKLRDPEANVSRGRQAICSSVASARQETRDYRVRHNATSIKRVSTLACTAAFLLPHHDVFKATDREAHTEASRGASSTALGGEIVKCFKNLEIRNTLSLRIFTVGPRP